MARFGEKELAFLRRVRPFADGTPAYHHLGDLLASLNAGNLQSCFVGWIATLAGIPDEAVPHDMIASGQEWRRSTKSRLQGAPASCTRTEVDSISGQWGGPTASPGALPRTRFAGAGRFRHLPRRSEAL